MFSTRQFRVDTPQTLRQNANQHTPKAYSPYKDRELGRLHWEATRPPRRSRFRMPPAYGMLWVGALVRNRCTSVTPSWTAGGGFGL